MSDAEIVRISFGATVYFPPLIVLTILPFKSSTAISYSKVFAAGNSISEEDQSKIQYLNNLEGKFAGWVLTNTEDIPEQAGKIGKLVEV